MCRHHMYEIILRAVFELKMTHTSGPNVLLFQRFQEEWGKYKSYICTLNFNI